VQILPSWMTTVLLALLLTFISYKLLVRGFITWHSESTEFLELQNQGLHHDGQDGLEQPLLQDRSANPPTGGRPCWPCWPALNGGGGGEKGGEREGGGCLGEEWA